MKFSKCKIGGLLVSLLGLTIMGCATATVEAPACDSQSVDFGTLPSIPAGTLPNAEVAVSLPPQDVKFDLSNDINKIDSVAKNLQVVITKLVVQSAGDGGNDMAWVRRIAVRITGMAFDNSTPTAELGAANGPNQIQITMSDADVLRYLSSGPVTLTINISGVVSASTIPSGDISNSVNLCVAVSGDFSKSL